MNTNTKKIEKINKEFNALDRAGKIRKIAKDVLCRVKSKNIIAKEGSWLNIDPLGAPDSNASIQNIILEKQYTECRCCALGGLLLGMVCNTNNFTYADGEDLYIIDDGEFSKLKPVQDLIQLFGEKTLKSIEFLFEVGYGAISDDLEDMSYNLPTKFWNFFLSNLGWGKKNELAWDAWRVVEPEDRFKTIFRYLEKHGKFDPIDFCKTHIIPKDNV